MQKACISLVAALGVFVAPGALATSGAVSVTAQIENGGVLVFAPTIVTELDQEVMAEVSPGGSGGGGYRLYVLVKHDQGDVYALTSRLFRFCNGEWTAVAAPGVTVKAGTEASVMLSDEQGNAEWTFTFRVSA